MEALKMLSGMHFLLLVVGILAGLVLFRGLWNSTVATTVTALKA